MSNDENREKNEEKAAVPVQPIIDMGSTVVKNSRGTVHCLTIVGQVEGHTLLPDNLKSITKYEHVLPLLAALEQNEQVDGVLLLLNTVGGDIEAGLAIAEMVAGMTKPTVTLVLGGGHSIGVPLAVCGKRDVHRAHGVHDGAPGADVRDGHCRAGDVPDTLNASRSALFSSWRPTAA